METESAEALPHPGTPMGRIRIFKVAHVAMIQRSGIPASGSQPVKLKR